MLPISVTCALKPECGFEGQQSSTPGSRRLGGAGQVQSGESGLALSIVREQS